MKDDSSLAGRFNDLVHIGEKFAEVPLWDETFVTERPHEMWLDNVQALHVRCLRRYHLIQTLKHKTMQLRSETWHNLIRWIITAVEQKNFT